MEPHSFSKNMMGVGTQLDHADLGGNCGMKIDEIELIQNLIVGLKKLGYSDWYVGDKCAVVFRVIEIIGQDRLLEESEEQ